MEVSPAVQSIITAQTGGTVFSPLLTRNHIQGSVTIIQHLCPDQDKTSPEAPTEELISRCKQNLKFKLKEKYRSFKEGHSHHGTSTPLKKIYTDLYITEGGSGEVNSEHEVRQIETSSRKQTTEDTPIKCNDIFKPSPGQDKVIRTVLTRGVAGIGKTVSVQKFILDWAEGEANQDITLIFPFAFRELNLKKETTLSLLDLIHQVFSGTKELHMINCDVHKVMFILDGLDEYRLPLDFQNNHILLNVTEPASVDVLLTNLIKGNLLPSALLWITSRPAAANQIPPQFVDQVTEIRGFNDVQKEEYFRKKIMGQIMAERIISHIKSSKSLFIMCHIPVFCWIAATVLEKMLSEAERGEIPKTLTQMFTHFLLFQIRHKDSGSCDPVPQEIRESILALGKLAFTQLEKGNLIFYKEDLRECGIQLRDASLCSGVFVQMFREVFGLHLEKVFSFVHLSVQEFMAALYAFVSFSSENRNVLLDEEEAGGSGFFTTRPAMSDFLKSAVDKTLQSQNGHLDLFLRFLLGLSLESNQTLLRNLLTETGSSSNSKEIIVKYIKEKIRENPSPEKFINLFHCLNELKDDSLVQEVQAYLKTGGHHRLSRVRLSPAQWSALVFVLLNSDEELDEFDLSKYDKTEECLLKLLPVAKSSRKVLLDFCGITEEGCTALFKALKLNPVYLRELNINYNKPGESGVKELSDLLTDPDCKLQTLQLECCSVTEEGFTALFKALKLNPSHLRELNINYNKPGESGVKMLCNLLKDPDCKLETLQMSDCSVTDEGCVSLFKALKFNPSFLTELNLSNNQLHTSAVKQLSDLLQDPVCHLQTLHLFSCELTEQTCALLASALSCELCRLTELDLSNNDLQDAGVQILCAALQDPHCTLHTLRLKRCSMTGVCCADLGSVISMERSAVRDLDLSENQLLDSGVKLLSAGLESPHCKLEILGLEQCSITEKGCADLVKALKSNPSHLLELNLNNNHLEESGEKQLSDLLKEQHCRIRKLLLGGYNVTERSCVNLSSVLSSDSSSLSQLYLNDDEVVLPGSGVKLLSAGLEKIETQRQVDYSDLDEGCAALLKALRFKPSLMTELSLNLSKAEESGVEELSDLLKDPHCKLNKLHITALKPRRSSYKHTYIPADLEEPHLTLHTQQLFSPSQPLRELDLTFIKIGDSGVTFLFDLLKPRTYKLEKLNLRWCNLTEKSCRVLASALSSQNNLRELILSKNKLQDSGVQLLSAALLHHHCQLRKLSLCGCGLTERSCEVLSSVLSSDSCRLTELSLNTNRLQDSGVQLISTALQSLYCRLEILGLKDCSITDAGFCALAKALRLNSSSQLRELNLTANKPGETGLKLISNLLTDPHSKLLTIE